MAEQFIGTEATGVYKGVLVEDMIDTVQREHRLYCNVHIEQFFRKDSDYPLTYVPFWALSLPLKKDDVVLVEFHQGNLMYPVLYKNDSELDADFCEDYEIPESFRDSGITNPETSPTVNVIKIGDDSFVINAKDYTLIRKLNSFVLIDKNEDYYIQGKNGNVTVDGNLNISISKDVTIKAVGDGNITIDADKGKINVHSAGEMSVKTDKDLTIENSSANGKINIKTGGPVSLESTSTTGGINIKCDSTINLESSAVTGEINVKGSGTINVQTSSQTGTINIKGNSVGGVKINNHLTVR